MSFEERMADTWLKNRNSVSKNTSKRPCPIWGESYNLLRYAEIANVGTTFWSPRAGGTFILSSELMEGRLLNDKQNTLELCEKFSFSRWVYEENRYGRISEVNNEKFEKIITIHKLLVEEKVLRLLESFTELPVRPFDGIFTGGSEEIGAYDPLYLTMANCEIQDVPEFNWLLSSASENGYITNQNTVQPCITPKGITESSTTKRKIQSEQAFVAMWFDDTMNFARKNAIRPAIEAAGYRAYFADEDKSYTNEQVTNKILAEIKNSKCLIADFTHGPDGARGGVYFEAGYALALGIPVIWLIKKDDVSKMHFDTDHYPHIIWKDEEHLKEELNVAMLAHQHIGKGPVTHT